MEQPDKPMHGKVCIVTGAASGIGAITAQALAQQGAAVILADRNSEMGAVTVNQIKQQTGNSAVEFMWADPPRRRKRFADWRSSSEATVSAWMCW